MVIIHLLTRGRRETNKGLITARRHRYACFVRVNLQVSVGPAYRLATVTSIMTSNVPIMVIIIIITLFIFLFIGRPEPGASVCEVQACCVCVPQSSVNDLDILG